MTTTFLFLFRGGDPLEAGMTPSEAERHLGRWHTWSEHLKDTGVWLAGEPLEQDGRVVRGGDVVTDGPFAESKELVGGYVLLTAGSLEQASEIAKGCPIFETDGTVEVRPVPESGLCANEAATSTSASRS